MDRSKITFFILVHHLRSCTLDSLRSYSSALAGTKVIISYNGNTELEELSVFAKSLGFSIRHSDTVNFFDHFFEVVEYCNTIYLMVLHDDDFLDKEFGTALFKQNLPKGTSFAVEDKVRVNGFDKVRIFKRQHLSKVTSTNIILSALMNRHYVAFPGIIYLKQHLIGLDKAQLTCGKYSDTQILIHIADKSLLTLSEPLLIYRIHQDQDSAKVEKAARKRLVKLLWIKILEIPMKGKFKDIIQSLRYLIRKKEGPNV